MKNNTDIAFNRVTGYWVLLASICAASMAFVASTSLNVALPAIQVELSARGADLIWIPNSYVLVQASLIVVTGSMGDHFGRNRVCLWGILLFGLASVVCGFSTTTNVIIAGRVAQGFGSSMIVPNSLAIASSYFSRNGQGWAIGIWSGFTVLASGLAPFFAGVVTDFGMWRLVFFIHIPLGVLAALVIIRFVPESYDREAPRRMSLLGSLLIILGLGGLTFGFIESSTYGFDSPIIIAPIIIGALAIARFLYDERKGIHAILPLRLFRSRTFSAANLISLVYHGVVQPMVVYLPLNLIQVQGYSATFTGLSTVPMILLATIGSALVGPLLDRRGPRLPLVLGFCLTSMGFVVISNVGVTGGESEYFSTFFPPIFLFGLGFGMVFAPLTMAALASAPDNNAGIASGVNNTVVRTGQVLVIGILGGLAISWFGENLANDPYVQSLPAAAQTELAADSGDLAETSIPDSLTEDEKEGVRQVIRHSFAQMFSTLMSIAAVFCLLAALVAWFLIDDRELKSKRRRAIESEPIKPAEAAESNQLPESAP
ncbi:MAG: MFS transporter [Chloroflexota bacterium]|nr:MFS transporter [Chloroflexota bacterium]MDE2948078.1 MFS transporter [Chloroflexota bacterium]